MTTTIRRIKARSWAGNGFGYNNAEYGVFVGEAQTGCIQGRDGCWSVWEVDPSGTPHKWLATFYKKIDRTGFNRAKDFAKQTFDGT